MQCQKIRTQAADYQLGKERIMDAQTSHDIAVLRGELNQFKSSLGARDMPGVVRITKEIIAAIKQYETEIAAMQQEITALQKQVAALAAIVKP